MEQAIISGVTHDTSEAKVTIEQVPDRPGIAASVFRALADEDVNVDMIVQNTSTGGTTDISFTVPRADLAAAMHVSEDLWPEIGGKSVNYDAEIGRVSIVGAGMKTNPGVAARMFRVLADEGVNIEMISTSSIRISCVVRARDVEKAVRALHADSHAATIPAGGAGLVAISSAGHAVQLERAVQGLHPALDVGGAHDAADAD